MSESQNSQHSELTKEEQDTAYKSVILLAEAITDLDNCEMFMNTGRFFDAKDKVIEAKIRLQSSKFALGTFVNELKVKKIWL